MNKQLISEKLLAQSDKILFITHLAIGDYTYMQTYFKALSQAYPHIKIDLWIDELRRTWCFWRWESLKKYSLYDWVENCSFFRKIYKKTYSPFALSNSVREAQKEKYPIVVFMGGLRPHNYADLARSIAPQGFIVGVQQPVSKFNFLYKKSYKKFDAVVDTRRNPEEIHITDTYAGLFKQIFGIYVDPVARAPFVDIPQKWVSYAKFQFLKRGIDKKNKNFGKVFFINPFAKNKKRCWPIEHVVELIMQIKQDDQWQDISFIVNVVPEEFDNVNTYLKKRSVNDVFLFTASTNFFQLPAMISCCDLIISVETATIHLASALHVPVVALMRQKNPEWAPWDTKNSHIVTTGKRSHWIKDIPVVSIVHAVKKFSQNYF